MIKYLNIALFAFISGTATAQINEIGVSVGASNTIGDIGPTKYVNPTDFGYGIQYRWNRSPRHSWRANYTYIPVSGKDSDSDMGLRKARNLQFENTLHEVALGLEFNFFEFDLHNDWFAFTPYVYTGLAGFAYKDSHFNAKSRQVLPEENSYALAIPMTVGVKTVLNKRIVLSAEVGFRYTFTDNIDGNNPSMTSSTIKPFGNTNSNDWYVFSGVSVSYTFGKNPCYCLPR